MTNPPTNSVDSELEQIVAFLCGEAPYKGYWYGEKAKGKPMFWWRKDLRDALQAINNLYIKREDVERAIEQCKIDGMFTEWNGLNLVDVAELRAKLLTPKGKK